MAGTRRRRDLLVAGHVNVDRFLRVRRFPARDRTEPVLEERTELGGTATNLVRVATRLGVRSGILARVGAGFPVEFRRTLRREGIDLRGLSSDPSRPTPACTIVEDPEGVTRTLIQQGPMGDGAGAFPAAADGWLRGYAWLHLSTGRPDHYVELARRAHELGVKVAADPAQEIFYRWTTSNFGKLLNHAELLFGNREEIRRAQHLAGGGGRGLLARVPLVVRTEGSAGATALTRSGRVHVAAARPDRRRSLVGAGDAFRGGFYAAWFAGQPLVGCLRAGNRSAARWISGPE